jgi:hypothetical protein
MTSETTTSRAGFIVSAVLIAILVLAAGGVLAFA